MTVSQLDFLFPFVVFLYGFSVVVVLETPVLARLGRERLSPVYEGLSRRRGLAWISFFLGGLWSLQNIWLA